MEGIRTASERSASLSAAGTLGVERRLRKGQRSKGLRVGVVFGALAGRAGRISGAAWSLRALGLARKRSQQGAWRGSVGAARGAKRHHGSQNESQALSNLLARSTSQSRSET